MGAKTGAGASEADETDDEAEEERGEVLGARVVAARVGNVICASVTGAGSGCATGVGGVMVTDGTMSKEKRGPESRADERFRP